MGDKDALTKARLELEAFYEGMPDESINLTFRHLSDIKINSSSSLSMEKKNMNSSSIPRDEEKSSPLIKIPSLDFNRGLQAAGICLHPRAQPQVVGARGVPVPQHLALGAGGFREALENSMAYDNNVSPISFSSMHQRDATPMGRPRRRPGIPHSNICTNCSTYIYIFRHRCLVCGRVYCRQCLRIGMGEMIEGRKCVECLGRRFSHRYIARAGDVGCFGWSWRYPSMVKQEELKWAEKGPRRKGEKSMHLRRGYGHGHGVSGMSMTSMSQSPWAATSMDASTITGARFSTMSSPYSPAHRHHIPF